MSTTETALTAHLVVPEEKGQNNRLILQARRGLHDKFEIVHTTLQLESGEPFDLCPQRSAEVV